MHALLIITFLLIITCITIAALVIINKYFLEYRNKTVQKINSYLIKSFTNGDIQSLNPVIRSNPFLFFDRLIFLLNCCQINREYVDLCINLLKKTSIPKKLVKMVRSGNPQTRAIAAKYLSHLGGKKNEEKLIEMLAKEKYYYVKILIIDALVYTGSGEAIPSIIQTLLGSPLWFQRKAIHLLIELDQKLYKYLQIIYNVNELPVKRLIITFANRYYSEDLRSYLVQCLNDPNEDIAVQAAEVVENNYPELLNDINYLASDVEQIRMIAIRSLASRADRETIEMLSIYLADEKNSRYAIHAITGIITKSPILLDYLIALFNDEDNDQIKKGLAYIFSNKLEMILVRLLSRQKSKIRLIIHEIIRNNITTGIIGFLNRNKNEELEKELCAIIKEEIACNGTVKESFQFFLNPDILTRIDLQKKKMEKEKREEKVETGKIVTLWVTIILLIFTMPVLHMLRYRDICFSIPLIRHLELFVVDCNYLLAYYSIVINAIYLFLLTCAFYALKTQVKSWKIKGRKLFYKEKMLPSISIIAPAYGEEFTIIESTNSLLNLNYPDYELIIVNDGSLDNTMQLLQSYYHLEMVDMLPSGNLNTMPIVGVYINPSYPKLKVIDKINGGKADSLNVGINYSTKEYFCGIDADSLLEPDTLLKISSQFLDSDFEAVAAGGNIFPVNGCKVDKGTLTPIGICKTHLTRFQTIEYLRAFMAGRLGWSQLNSLLIISGAFGLFKKKYVIEAGGYLTSKSKYAKDTVGEDMELVVRLTKNMYIKKRKFRINYAYNANCWTEVPEDIKILYNQRNRWHRGLIDILFFHRSIIGNPKFGRIGLLAFPYFVLFEFLGPLIEASGYLMVVSAAILGFLNVNIILLLFISSILLGMVVSISSLYIAEKETSYYTIKEVLILIFYSFIENLGFRQYVSFWRVLAYFSSMGKPKGWGKMKRKGFKENKAL